MKPFSFASRRQARGLRAWPARRSGFSLIEVTLAIGIVAFAFMILIGLLPIGLGAAKESSQERGAGGILAALVADLRVAPGTGGLSPRFGIPLKVTEDTPGELFFDLNGNAVAADTAPLYRVRWVARPERATERAPASIHLRVEWPALAARAEGGVETLEIVSNRLRPDLR